MKEMYSIGIATFGLIRDSLALRHGLTSMRHVLSLLSILSFLHSFILSFLSSLRSILSFFHSFILSFLSSLRSILSFFHFFIFSLLYASAYYTHPLIPEVHTLQVITDGDFQRLPVIDNSDNSSLEISFDYLDDEQLYLQYTLVHCDAQWEADRLSELDYVDGFLPARVEEVQPSFNTTVNYWHYTLRFPREEVRLLVSGNYAVIFHPEDDPDAPVAVACFSVTEQMAFVSGEVSGVTDIDYLASHQQLTLQCSWSPSRLPYLSPTSDLHLVVTQNHRPDTRRDLLQPSRVDASHAWYEHQPLLIFEGGNTFRRFEFIDPRYATLGIERLRYEPPYYVAELVRQRARSGSAYYYDQDQHGRYLVHALRVDDEATESEYFWADFTLDGAIPPLRGRSIYLTGDFTYGELTPDFQLRYDPDLQCFTARVLLKQGHYNYQFLCGTEWSPADVPSTSGTGSSSFPNLSPLEGSYYDARNQYDVYVYYRGPSDRYDRLLGVAQLSL